LDGTDLRVSKAISRAKTTRILDLSDCSLSHIPESVFSLTNLQLLSLDENNLTELPRELWKLTDLRELRLDHNHLSHIPPGISQLKALGSLFLNGNLITDLPADAAHLTHLQSLMLIGNRLKVLPKAVTQLGNLRRLRLAKNQITTLPSTIGSLANLAMLSLDDNSLSNLPPEIGHLGRLEQLSLDGNVLFELPSEIEHLERLRSLSIRGNFLTSLPPEIEHLGQLRELDVRNNKLAKLPSTLANLLKDGLNLIIDGNPVSDSLPNFSERGADALATYLTSLEDGEPQYEAKVLLVGEGNVGKTSLIAALHNENFVADRDTTHGIEIQPLTLGLPGRTRKMTLRTWDFGGQEVYRITHQFFFTKRALYLVVWSAREGQERNEVEDWLMRIRLRVAADARILIVATHCDERRPELDYPQLAKNFPGLLAGAYEVDNRTRTGVQELTNVLAVEAGALPQMGQLISPRWTRARDDILARGVNDPQISFDDFTEICKNNSVAPDEIRTLAEYLHDLGQIIYYGDDEGLKEVVVLNPEWLTKAISYVLEDKVTRDSFGILDHRRLKSVWQDGSDGLTYPSRYHPYFLRLMEKFDVSYRIDDAFGASLVPQLLPHERPMLPWEAEEKPSEPVRSLSLICKLSEPAPGLIAWLTVRHHRSSVSRHWRRGVFLRHPITMYQSEALLELRTPHELFLDVRAPSPDLFFNVLRDSVESLITTRWPGITYDLLIPCPTRQSEGSSCGGRFKLEGLLRYRERGGAIYPCLECGSEHDVSRLLTGYDLSGRSIKPELERLERQVVDIADGVGRLEKVAAETAESVRRILTIANTEVKDCPRLFTIVDVPTEGIHRVKGIYQRTYSATLWCEHTDHWHPWPAASYTIDQPRTWLVQLLPYASLIVKALKLAAPIAATIADVGLGGINLVEINDNLQLMDTIFQEVASSEPSVDIDDVKGSGGGLEPAEGQSLRAFRVFLFERDKARSFGDLRRVQAPSGELLWVCPTHHAEYDPGLPEIPGAQG
jgi:internalin A